MITYEYDTMHANIGDPRIGQQLSEYGRGGWRVISATRLSDAVVLFVLERATGG